MDEDEREGAVFRRAMEERKVAVWVLAASEF